MNITNDFVESFDNGMALCALVHAYDPSLIAYEMLDPARKLDNLALGMHLAEQYLGVAKMLDPADVAGADDKAMMVSWRERQFFGQFLLFYHSKRFICTSFQKPFFQEFNIRPRKMVRRQE